MSDVYSIAIETSCREGGVALGRGGQLVKAVAFDASLRQAGQLVQRLDELLRGEGLRPGDLGEAYVSAGPGGFTGLRIGITAARTLAQALPGLRTVAVPTAEAVAENARDLTWDHLAVLLDYKEGEFHAALFTRGPHGPLPAGAAELAAPESFFARAPRPLLVMGEAAQLAPIPSGGVSPAPGDIHLPRPEGVWRAGRRRAEAGEFTDPARLLPIYTRKPEAVRLWELRKKESDGPIS
jgi:tRNA threonylcarbamoyladenosine biosynthesis protein TsaB